MKRPTVDELTRLAFCWAEQDRAALADAWPEGSSERAKTEAQLGWLKFYRLKRWGRTRGDDLDGLQSKSISELVKEGKA